MQVTLEPVRGLVDEPVAIVVSGPEAGNEVDLIVTTVDTAGHVWRSEGRYRVGVGGTLELGDADRPWWDMAFADTAAAPVAFSAPDTELEFTVEVRAGAESASAGVTRCWGRDVSREDLSGDGWRLRVYCPHTDRQSAPAVLVVPGTTGLAAAAPTAALLASHGFVAGVLAYMQESGLPDTFQRIPLEAAASGVQAFTTRADVAPARLTILAYSVGTTLTLALLSSDDAPRVQSVIAVAPSGVVWQALGQAGPPPKMSSLTQHGQDLPYAPIRGEKLLGQVLANTIARYLPGRPRSHALRLRAAFTASLTDETVSAARITVERIDAPMLLIAGDQDAMWPAATMASDIIDRRGHRPDDQLLILPGAGHFLRPPATPSTVDRNADLVSGGTPPQIASGQRRAWAAIREHLESTRGA